MFARTVAIFAFLAMIFVTTVASAHAAGMTMTAAPDHGMQSGDMIEGHDMGLPFFDGKNICGSSDAGKCAFACAGVSVFLVSPNIETGPELIVAKREPLSSARHDSRPPELNERPPRTHLL